jgi:hypothetical protein
MIHKSRGNQSLQNAKYLWRNTLYRVKEERIYGECGVGNAECGVKEDFGFKILDLGISPPLPRLLRTEC